MIVGIIFFFHSFYNIWWHKLCDFFNIVSWVILWKCIQLRFAFQVVSYLIMASNYFRNIHFSVTHFQFKNGRSHAMTFFLLLLFNRSFMTVLEYRKLTKFFSYFFFFSCSKIIMTIYLDGNLNDFRVQIDGKNIAGDVH